MISQTHSLPSFSCENLWYWLRCGFFVQEFRAFELLRSGLDRSKYLLVKEAKIIAMTCTHAALKRHDLVELGFKVNCLNTNIWLCIGGNQITHRINVSLAMLTSDILIFYWDWCVYFMAEDIFMSKCFPCNLWKIVHIFCAIKAFICNVQIPSIHDYNLLFST